MRSFVATPQADKYYRQIGEAHVYLVKAAGTPVKTDALSGRLYFSRSGWLLLSVPNALGRGAFDALDESGVELPVSEVTGQYNAHITVMRPEEIAQIGGPDKITERGHSYRYSLGPIKEVEPKSWNGVSKVWYIAVDSPELQKLRKSYGLSPLPRDNKEEFHITIAIRKTKVLQNNDVSKAEKKSASFNEKSKAAREGLESCRGVLGHDLCEKVCGSSEKWAQIKAASDLLIGLLGRDKGVLNDSLSAVRAAESLLVLAEGR